VAPVTSGGGMGWLPIAAVLAIVLAVVAVVAVLATRRRRQPHEPAPPGTGRVDEVPGGEGVALATVAPAENGAGGEEGAAAWKGEEGAAAGEARALIKSTMDRLAAFQEAQPDEALDLSPVTDKLDIAREMLGTGAADDALDFAREAGLEADRITAPNAHPESGKTAVKRRRVAR